MRAFYSTNHARGPAFLGKHSPIENVPMQAISLGMGHDNEETTRIYLASIQTNVIDNAYNKILNLLEKNK